MSEPQHEFATIESTGERFRILESPEDLLRLDWYLPAGGRSPVHLHPRQVERVTGVAGALRIGWQGGSATIGARESYTVPAGLPHSFENRGPDEAHMIVDFLPALDIRRFFESTAGLNAAGRMGRGGGPRDPLLLAVYLREYAHVFTVATPPPLLQRLLLTPVAALGRKLGRRAHEPSHALVAHARDRDAEEVVRGARPLA